VILDRLILALGDYHSAYSYVFEIELKYKAVLHQDNPEVVIFKNFYLVKNIEGYKVKQVLLVNYHLVI